MLSTVLQNSRRSTPVAAAPPGASRALEWMWAHLRDERHPGVFDCGPVSQATLDVLRRRGAKLYVTDLVTPARSGAPEFWDRSRKQPVFRVDEFLAQLPSIAPESLTAVLGWHLLDFLPREALPAVVERLCSCLRPGGALFCLMREPLLSAGAETAWWLEQLLVLGSSREGREPFPYPSVTNREVERLAPACVVKTFLTRSGRREVLVLK